MGRRCLCDHCGIKDLEVTLTALCTFVIFLVVLFLGLHEELLVLGENFQFNF